MPNSIKKNHNISQRNYSVSHMPEIRESIDGADLIDSRGSRHGLRALQPRGWHVTIVGAHQCINRKSKASAVAAICINMRLPHRSNRSTRKIIQIQFGFIDDISKYEWAISKYTRRHLTPRQNERQKKKTEQQQNTFGILMRYRPCHMSRTNIWRKKKHRN